jgi:hypothetical protein
MSAALLVSSTRRIWDWPVKRTMCETVFGVSTMWANELAGCQHRFPMEQNKCPDSGGVVQSFGALDVGTVEGSYHESKRSADVLKKIAKLWGNAT